MPGRRHRGRLLATTLGALSLVVLALVPASATVATASSPRDTASTGAVPATQLSQLDFLLGNWKCTLTHVNDPAHPVTQFYLVRPILGGNWYEMNIYQPPDATRPTAVVIRTVIGWNPLTSNFVDFYYDNQNNQGTGTSPGLQDGHVAFINNLTINGRSSTFRDDFSPVDGTHFIDHFSVLRNGNWVEAGLLECSRREG
jgi:hypothetical protein